MCVEFALSCLGLLSPVNAAAQQTADSQQAPPRIVVDVNRVLVPVVVRDKQGRVVTDLKKENFQVLDDGKPHPVSAFTVERRAATRSNAVSNPGGGAQPPSAPNASPQSTVLPNRIVVFLFDDLHLTFDDLALAQRAASDAVTGVLVGSDMAAVVSTSGKINSGLTRDPAKLQGSILAVRPHTVNRPSRADCPSMDYYRADLIENKHDGAALQDAVQQLYTCQPGVPADTAERIVEVAARGVLEAGDQDVQASYAAIGEYVRRMAHLPGQRTMVLISPGFIAITPETQAAQSQVIDLAAQSNVTISALDTRGLYTTAVTASDNIGGRDPQTVADYRRSSMALAEGPMQELADGTGGAFFHNNNDLGAGLKSLTEAPERVYVLELSLDGVKPDGLYHRLKVKVDREGVQLQARRGYYSPKANKGNK